LHEQFIGGTIYQAFLSALSYHRWHAPVSGTVKKAYVKDGTYFSEPLFEGLGDPKSKEINKGGETDGQGYLTATATRAIIYIEADSKDVGLICFLGIGMTEVSTCDISVKEGQHIKKGEQLGMFHYGGSTHCVIFRKVLELEGFPEVGGKENLPVRSKLATVKGRD
jgi:phosphatidylserine decarboxylase